MNGRLISRKTPAVPAAKAAAVSHRARTGWSLPAAGRQPPVPNHSATGSANIIG